jgi:zinc and cadmium transporter
MHSATAILCLCLPILLTGAVAFAVGIKRSNLRLILAFSAAYLFALSIIHMLPEAIGDSGSKQTGLFIVIGFCLQLLIDTFSTGIEHGHVHLHSHSCHTKLPYGIIIGLYLHSFLEGLPVFNVVEPGEPVNYQLILGLGIHNIPITIAFVALLREHEHRRSRSLLLLFAFSMMALAGYLFSYFLQTVGLSNYEMFSRVAYAVVIGIFLHISTAILFESSDQHKYNLRKVLAMFGGIILAYIIS